MARIKVGVDVRIIPFEILWIEYEFGVNRNKAVKFFTAQERGKVKYLYSLRISFWTLMERMIRYGYTHTSAIEKIESVNANGTSKSIT